MIETSCGNYMTANEIASTVGTTIYRTKYAINVLGVEPVGRAGLVLLYSEDVVDRVRDAVEARRRPSREIATASR